MVIQIVYEGEIWCFCTVTFGQKFPKKNSSLVYCLQVYSKYPCLFTVLRYILGIIGLKGFSVLFFSWYIPTNNEWSQYTLGSSLFLFYTKTNPRPNSHKQTQKKGVSIHPTRFSLISNCCKLCQNGSKLFSKEHSDFYAVIAKMFSIYDFELCIIQTGIMLHYSIVKDSNADLTVENWNSKIGP